MDVLGAHCAAPAVPSCAMPGARRRIPEPPGRDAQCPEENPGAPWQGCLVPPGRDARCPGLSTSSVAWLISSCPRAGTAAPAAPQPPLLLELTADGSAPQSRLCGSLSPRRHLHLCCKPSSGEGEDAELIPRREEKEGKTTLQ